MIISRLVLENILTHKRTELVFDAGLNVVIGESGYGKTAVTRAFNWLLVGAERPETLLSQTSDRCRAVLTTVDRVQLCREWDGDREIYTVAVPGAETRSFYVGPAEIPPEVRKRYAIRASVLGPDLTVHLQLPSPGEDLFLINQPPAVKAKALGSLQGVPAAEAALADMAAADGDLKTEVYRVIRQSIIDARHSAGRELEGFVTSALRAAFAPDLRFVIQCARENEAEFVIVSCVEGGEVAAPVPAHGSGMAEFTALALRLAFIVTARPPLTGPVVLDEPCPSVSDQYVSNVARFLKATTDRFGVQIIVMTYNQRMTEAADAVNVLLHRDGVTNVQYRGGSIRAKSRPR